MRKLVILLLGVTNFVFAQQEKSFKHTVAKGETVFQIAKNYNVSAQDILKLNPGAENGLQENTSLIIPNHQSISYMLKKNDIAAEKYTQHQVTAKETLYSISMQHNISVEELEKNNIEILKNGLKEGQTLQIPLTKTIAVTENKTLDLSANVHEVQSKETLFSIARLYNVSVKDLDELNLEVLKDGLKIGQKIAIPNKKKTISGAARIINTETVFHTVLPKETKYSISKKYGITIEQLEAQNPEIISGLVEGNKLAINTSKIKAKNENEELMIALAEKQAEVEKNKAKTLEIEDLQDRLAVQKDLNRKMITLNKLNINLNAIDETKTGSVDKLKLILDANKNIQDVLIAKLDSLATTMERDLVELKNTDVETLEESKKLEKASYKNIGQTNEIITQLKQNLAENRKIFSGIMNKVQRLTVQENQEYKKKVRENLSNKDLASLEEMNKLKEAELQNEQKNAQLLTKIDQINSDKKNELKRKISKATFYSSEAREYDDKLALVKLQRYQKNAVESQKDVASTSQESVDAAEIRKKLNAKVVDGNKLTKIEVIRNLKEVANGYYMVANLFTEAQPRDEFAVQLTDSGETKTSFFYNVGNFSYYVYTKVFSTADEAIYEYNLKINEPLYKNLFIVQISNEQ